MARLVNGEDGRIHGERVNHPTEPPGTGWTRGGGLLQDGDAMEDVTFDRKKLADLLGSEPRLGMRRELSKGGPFTVGEMAEAGGVGYSTAWGHLQRMVRAGAVVPFKSGTYILAPGVLAEGGGRVLRLGMATLDFGAEAEEG